MYNNQGYPDIPLSKQLSPMKKNYPLRLIAFMFVSLCAASLSVHGQNWKLTSSTTHQGTPAVQQAPVTGGNIHVGHCNYSEQIYEWDGLSHEDDLRVGVAVKLTRDMFADYIGGSVKALRIGWDTKAYNGNIEGFIRTSFNGPDLATTSGTVRFGWNNVPLSSTFVIPDVDELIVGYYTDLKDGECCIPTFYPKDQPNSCYLFSGGYEGESEVWEDHNEFGPLAIMMTIVDQDGRFNNLGRVTKLRYENIAILGKDGTGVFTIRNTGSNAINSLEITSAIGDNAVSKTVNLSASIAPNASKKVSLPITFPGSGKGNVSLTKINGVACANPAKKEATFIAIPEAVAQKYSKRPLIEFFVSENNYRIPIYFDEYFMADFTNFAEDITLVCQHVDDQFMIGDDEALTMMVGLAGNDSTKVYMPAMAIDRSDYMTNITMVDDTPFLFGVPYPGNGAAMYRGALQKPTFASVGIESENFGNDSIMIRVSGTVEPGVMPAGEPLFLTVYLMENQVKSESQKFWDDKGDKDDEGSTIAYTHYNLVREVLTPMWGQEVHPAEDGTYEMTYYAKRYSDYQPDKLSITAFLNRGEQNPNMERNIINSEVALAPLPVGIESVGQDAAIEQRGGAFFINGRQAEVYSASGVRINGKPNMPGVYILRAGDRTIKMKF